MAQHAANSRHGGGKMGHKRKKWRVANATEGRANGKRWRFDKGKGSDKRGE